MVTRTAINQKPTLVIRTSMPHQVHGVIGLDQVKALPVESENAE